MRNLILLAAPGAGKGTLAKSLKEKYNYVHISTGDLLRDRVASNDELGQKIDTIMKQGGLVSSDIVYQVLEDRLQQSDCNNGYILDGFPRSVEQADKYEEIINKINRDLGIVILLDIDKELLLKRITGRRICKECGAIYNVYNPELTSKVESICDKCGGSLYQRTDDNETSFETRYNTYLENTQPLIDYYQEKGILHVVDSTDSKKTLAEVEELLNKLGDSFDNH